MKSSLFSVLHTILQNHQRRVQIPHKSGFFACNGISIIREAFPFLLVMIHQNVEPMQNSDRKSVV